MLSTVDTHMHHRRVGPAKVYRRCDDDGYKLRMNLPESTRAIGSTTTAGLASNLGDGPGQYEVGRPYASIHGAFARLARRRSPPTRPMCRARPTQLGRTDRRLTVAPLVLGRPSGRLAEPPQCGAPGPLDVALSLLVHRCFPLAAGSVRIALDWLGLPPATATRSTGQVAARQGVSRQRVLFVLSRLRGAAGMIPPPPALAGCLTFIKQGPAARHAGVTAAALYSAGLVACPVHPETVRRAAELFEVTPRLRPAPVAGWRVCGHRQACARL